MKTPYYFYTKYCWSNEIFIYPVPIVSNGSVCKIAIKIKGVEKIGEEKFIAEKNNNHLKMYQKIETLYKTIYEKKNEPLNIKK